MARVLIAEDNTENVLLIRDFCKDMDFEAEIVEDGRAVIEAVRASPPDLVLMDIHAPVIDGLAATIEIRSLQNVSEQMMIIGLNSDLAALSSACRIAGMNQILSNPLQPERLIAALRAVRAPLNLQASAVAPEQRTGPAESEEELLQRMAEAFGPMPAETPFGRLYYINHQKLAGLFGEAWPAIAANVEVITRLSIERHIGESAAYKKFDELDFILMTPGLTREACTAKCQIITQEICRTLAADKSGAKFHIRTVIFHAKPPPPGSEAAIISPAEQARLDNPDILSWTRLRFWPVWDTQRRKFPIHTIRADRDEDGALLPEALETIENFGPAAYHEALDISLIADLTNRLDGHDTLEQPRLLTLPVHYQTLDTFTTRSRYLRYIEQIPKKIRERMVIELHDLPKDLRAVQIAELQKPILAHCLHTTLVVSPLYRNFGLLKQVSNQIVSVELSEDEAEAEQELAALKQFGTNAKQSGLTVAATLVRNRPFRDWGLTSCRYVSGPVVALAQRSLGPTAKFIA